MDRLLRDLINEGSVIVYLDDIMIFTDSLEEHRKIVSKVLQILADNQLYLKPEKCEFEKKEVEYLGMIISHDMIRMDPLKVQAVAEWPIPRTKKELQSFLGFSNFYRRFIRDYGKIAKPLTILTGKVDWEWAEDQQRAFDVLKKTITTSPTLAIPNDEDPFKVECDASNYATGAVLSQQQEGKWRPVAFLSKSMNPAERNYAIWDKEMLA
ncbi:hypothetical protein SERLA73DRAFT_157560, partial [Serpula lacrymans var. lacrymans S7.3]